MDDLAYRNILDGNQSREFEFTMKSREDFVPLIYERPVVDAFAEAVGPDSTVLDIGSYHGFYALLAASQPNTDVYAFEPNEANRQELSSNLELNPAGENVTVVPEAVLDENSETTYASSGVKTTMGTGTKRISTVTLDTFCERHELQPDVLKIDVEGQRATSSPGRRGRFAGSQRCSSRYTTIRKRIRRKCSRPPVGVRHRGPDAPGVRDHGPGPVRVTVVPPD
ncbi:FkbM family methyltransferase [Haloarculaceae archaeon H-GB2-1]|nr:FkbM family methyltransferase [Haloarculaceae archaeon H-GB2-1]